MIPGRDLIDDIIDRPAFFADAACKEHDPRIFPERGESLAAPTASASKLISDPLLEMYGKPVG